MRALLLGLLLTATAQAQFEILPSPTTADLRGIHAVSPEIAWASGTNGTVLRTTDAGAHWTLCPTPPSAEHLDFRGIQAFDAQTAIVMSSGKGSLSRLYKTTDACATWTLLFTNPDPEGSWAAIKLTSKKTAILVGDPVKGRPYLWHLKIRRDLVFPLYGTDNSGTTWDRLDGGMLYASKGNHNDTAESIFAFSNSSLLELEAHSDILFVTGGRHNSLHVLRYSSRGFPLIAKDGFAMGGGAETGLATGPTAGGFSIAADGDTQRPALNIVGGDYALPDKREGTASSCRFGSRINLAEQLTFYLCEPAQTPPHGFRSSVAYSPATKTWITVGPNGTDISTDDGRNWRPLTPNPAAGDPPDADRNWNALSLPYVVGPHGRIGKLRPQALSHP